MKSADWVSKNNKKWQDLILQDNKIAAFDCVIIFGVFPFTNKFKLTLQIHEIGKFFAFGISDIENMNKSKWNNNYVQFYNNGSFYGNGKHLTKF